MHMVESLPKLERLSLENLITCETVSNFQVVPMPHLHHLIIVTLRAPINLQSSNLPRTQLISLRLQGLHNVSSLVKLCPSLSKLVLVLDSELGETLPQPPVVVRHKHVKVLSLWFKKDSSSQFVEEIKAMKKVLDILEFPSLVTFSVRCSKRPLISHCKAGLAIVDKFIQRSSCTLTRFDSHNICIFDCLDIFTTILYYPPQHI
ncbi:hypothetical protein BDP27DRAFT_1341168 [Rhodocollybia butyracea]|uniref:Uncharacterized protein n=1 Tax=Rhodocollybia butyracea TaxID=206335 RepID=A0A9P5PA02_9AGAR|nr:hypothetical protein BDP27DRAFT_1341168 [Rhodocollybia butyracea]